MNTDNNILISIANDYKRSNDIVNKEIPLKKKAISVEYEKFMIERINVCLQWEFITKEEIPTIVYSDYFNDAWYIVGNTFCLQNQYDSNLSFFLSDIDYELPLSVFLNDEDFKNHCFKLKEQALRFLDFFAKNYQDKVYVDDSKNKDYQERFAERYKQLKSLYDLREKTLNVW